VAGCPAPEVTIAEVLHDPPGPDGRGEHEFVELAAPAGSTLDGLRLVAINDANGRPYQTMNLTGTVGMSGRWVVGGSAIGGRDAPLPAALQNGPDRIQLVDCQGLILDELWWPASGAATEQAWGGRIREGQSVVPCAPPSPWQVRGVVPSPGRADEAEACPVCADPPCSDPQPAAPEAAGGSPAQDAGSQATDADLPGESTDTLARTGETTSDATMDMSDSAGEENPTPGTWSPPVPDARLSLTRVPDPGVGPACDPGLQQGIRISEVLWDPAGTDTLAVEFVELDVPAGQSAAGMWLVHGDRADGRVRWAFRWPGGPIAGSTTWPVAGLDGGMGSVGGLPGLMLNGEQHLWLQDCSGTVVDVLAWGSMPAEASGEGWWRSVAPGGARRAGESHARCREQTAAVWPAQAYAAEPTPGERNVRFIEPGDCPALCPGVVPGSVRIQEILYNPSGPDVGHEFIEVSGPPGQSLDGMSVHFINGATDSPWAAPQRLTGVLGPSGVYVLGGSHVSPTDQLLRTTLQNGPETVLLQACDGGLLDAVAWGSFGSLPHRGRGEPALSVREGCSLTRAPGGADSGNNRRDFSAACPPTPGVP
jgi:hypothetical protein